MKKIALPLVFFVMICFSVNAQQISGFVFDTKFDRALEKVNIKIDKTDLGAVSDEQGYFEIKNIPEGNYLLTISRIGYMTTIDEVELTNDNSPVIYIYLQPSNITLNNDFVITARRVETDEFKSPEAISVVSKTVLRQESPRSTPEALEGITGVFMQKTNHGGGSPFIRGLTGNQNLMMIDGIRLNNATFRYGPNQYLNTIDPLTIGSIEVVRGSGSVLYGSDALGGVVQVLTKNPSFSKNGFDIGGDVYTKFMSQDMEKTGRAQVNASNEKLAFSGGFTYNDFGDIYGGDTTGKQSPTGYKHYAADAKLRMKLTANSELILAYNYDRQDDVARYDKVIANYEKYHFDPQIRQLGYARLKTETDNKWMKQIRITASFNQSDETRIKQKEGSVKVNNEHDQVNTYGTGVEINSYPISIWKFTSGVEYYFDKIASSITETEAGLSSEKRGHYPDGATSSSLAVYTSHTIDVKKFSFIVGGRFNAFKMKAEDEVFGNVDVQPSALVGSASVMYSISENYHLIASAYSAFRAPNLNDLSSFGTFNYGIEVPNTNLKPEKSINTEIGFKTRFDRFSGSFFLYRTQLTNLIDRVESTWQGQDSIDGEKVYTKENFSRAYIQGFEAEVQYEFISWLSAYGNITYTYGQNETLDEPLRRIPPLNSRLGLYYNCTRGFWSRLEWLSATKQNRLSSGDKKDSRIPEGGTPAWNVLNLRFGWGWKWLGISTGVNNIFDEDYRTHGSGINSYGRSFWLALRVSF